MTENSSIMTIIDGIYFSVGTSLNFNHFPLNIFCRFTSISVRRSIMSYTSSGDSSRIIVQKNGFEIKIADEPTPCCFKWYKAPSTLPNDLEKTYIEERPILDLSNDYNKRIGFTGTPTYQKGYRALEKIPYGIDENGNLQYLDFENSNFATFICGAARSGKSTLLHTLISGLIKNNHPDDIEIWLIDFKMTEFSRYISHLPPHVRYIMFVEIVLIYCSTSADV